MDDFDGSSVQIAWLGRVPILLPVGNFFERLCIVTGLRYATFLSKRDTRCDAVLVMFQTCTNASVWHHVRKRKAHSTVYRRRMIGARSCAMMLVVFKQGTSLRIEEMFD